MDGWITFWKITIVAALTVYFVVALLAAVLGARDLSNLVAGRIQAEDDEPGSAGSG
jgi:hypothetical protein